MFEAQNAAAMSGEAELGDVMATFREFQVLHIALLLLYKKRETY